MGHNRYGKTGLGKNYEENDRPGPLAGLSHDISKNSLKVPETGESQAPSGGDASGV